MTMVGEDERLRFLGLLDLPQHSSITIDGVPLVLKRSDFVGFVNLPAAANDDRRPHVWVPPGAPDVPLRGAFHFVSIRAAARNVREAEEEEEGGGGGGGGGGDNVRSSHSSPVAVGFVVPGRGNMIRQYDPSTEEVSPDPVDDEATVRNLLGQLRRGGAGPGDPRFADYAAVVGRDKQADWRELTDCISPGILRRRGIAEGGKLVPGAYNGDDLAADPPRGGSDGMSVAYPPIPVIAVGASPPQPPSHHRVHHHPGTKSYLSRLEPGQRTRLLLDPHPCAQVLGALLRDYYGGSWRDLIGDVQLSYLLFLHLHCFASLEHWRDLVAMLSLVDPRRLPSASTTSCPPDLRRVASEDLYPRLMGTLARQAEAVDEDFFDDAELSGDNALVPSLARLLRMRHDNVDDDGAAAALRSARDSLRGTLRRRFPSQFPPEGGPVASSAMDAGPRDDDEEEEDSPSGNDSVAFEYQDDEEDGPAVVASDELDASLARIAADRAATAAGSFGVGGGPTVGYSSELRDRYPVLFAALLPTEDVVMTCARALDDANDVSLVREAADYLQNVEARSGGEGPPIP